MRNLRGFYGDFAHDRKEDWDFLRAWEPSVVRLMLDGSHTDPNSVSVDRIRRVHETVPNALIVLRVWDVDDRNYEAHKAMVADPRKEADKQVDWWARVFDRIHGVPRKQLMAGLNNEPHPSTYPSLYTYTERAFVRGVQLEIRFGGLVFSPGTPPLPGEAPYDMTHYNGLEQLMIAGDHARIVHEYMQPEGMYAVWTDEEGRERRDYGFLIGRHKHWPTKRVKTIIGEWGIEGLLYNRHRDPQYGHSGWLNFPELWSPERYADEYVECIRQADDTVMAICPFKADYKDRTWKSFDVLPAYGALLERKDLCVKADPPALPVTPQPKEPETIFLPSVSKEARVNWERAWPVVLKIEGGLSLDPHDPGNYYQGKLIGTKFGISAAVWGGQYDIPNLTKEQALAIYKKHYWDAAGCNDLPWPMCLLVFDTAVNHGVGVARALLEHKPTQEEIYLGLRALRYLEDPKWARYGIAWGNRIEYLDNIVDGEIPA